MTTKPQELTVERYKFYKTQENPLADGKIAEIFGLNINQLNAFKKENDLIGKFDVRKTRLDEVKILKGSNLKKEEPSAVKTEIPLLKENDIVPKETAKERALKTIEEYQVNKKVQEKLETRKMDAVPEKGVMDAIDALSYSVKSTIGSSNTFDEAFSKDMEAFSEIKSQLQEELESLRKEKVWLEDRHVQDTAEKDELVAQLEKANQESGYLELIQRVGDAIKAERFRQNRLFGYQRHSNGDWLMILMEEVGEVAQAMQTEKGWGKGTDADNLYDELIHVAAVASAIAEQVLEERMEGSEGSSIECPTASAAAAH